MRAPDDELTLLRGEMDELNRRLVAALHERAALCRRIAAAKRRLSLPAVDAARETAMMTALVASVPGDGFAVAALANVLQVVFAESRALVTAILATPER
jgi:chorismate mutase